MDTLARFAAQHPAKDAVIVAETNQRLTYKQLHERSARLAEHLARRLPPAATIAILLGNRPEYLEISFGARRAGLYYVPISTHLTAGELGYILKDSGASVLYTESRQRDLLEALDPALRSSLRIVDIDDTAPGAEPGYRDITSRAGAATLPTRPMGLDFAYSSGTTGKPKGIRHALTGDPQIEKATRGSGWVSFFDLRGDSVYLSPAPLYHAAPLRFCIRCLIEGGTVVAMRKFDAEGALAAIAAHRVTHSQWVPTMFVRMLNLPAERRAAHDLSSHRMALHAAAPCPVDVKRRMLDWWGPIVWEYYTGSERAGATVISPHEWLQRPGSVGRAVQGRIRVVDERGRACPPDVDGLVCFEGGPRFQYHNDAHKTAEAHTPEGWATFGDIGHVDEDGYLYLTDRRANMIISGGVNIYPQEAENALLEHPWVHDVAVVGVPHADFGEEVKAVVELRDPSRESDATRATLIAHCRERLSHIKCPRSIDFARDLPRTETGKLLKRLIRDRYRAAAGSAPVAAAPTRAGDTDPFQPQAR